MGRKENGVLETFREEEGKKKNLVNEFRSDGEKRRGCTDRRMVNRFRGNRLYRIYLAFVSGRISSIFGKRGKKKDFGGHVYLYRS